jgi:RNA polymerase sigma-70 factor (ECF subfamily)
VSDIEFLNQIRANQGIIYKLVGLYAKDAEEKKDFYQEVLLNAWKGWPSFRAESKFSTWLYRICLNTIFTLKRKQHRIDYKDNLEAISPSVEHSGINKDEVQRLHQAIRLLSETDRAIISMHLDGFENSEIAAVLGISNNHVSVKLHRSKEQLSNLLKK